MRNKNKEQIFTPCRYQPVHMCCLFVLHSLALPVRYAHMFAQDLPVDMWVPDLWVDWRHWDPVTYTCHFKNYATNWENTSKL